MADVAIFLTSTDAIRASLGMDIAELTDAFLTGQKLDIALELQTARLFPTHEAIRSEGTATAPAPDPEQTRRWQLLQLYVQWAAACHVAGTMRAAFPILISDGKSQVRRGELDFDELRASVCVKETEFRDQLLEELGTAAGTTGTLFGKASPGYDPVTGPHVTSTLASH